MPLFLGSVYAGSVIDYYALPGNVIDYYAHHIPAGIKLTAYNGGDPAITDHERDRMISLGAFLTATLIYVAMPLFVGWLFLLLRFVLHNYPYHFPEGLTLSRKDVLIRCIKLFALSLTFFLTSLYTIFFDIHAFLDGMYLVYLSISFFLVVATGGVFIAIATFLLIITEKQKRVS